MRFTEPRVPTSMCPSHKTSSDTEEERFGQSNKTNRRASFYTADQPRLLIMIDLFESQFHFSLNIKINRIGWRGRLLTKLHLT